MSKTLVTVGDAKPPMKVEISNAVFEPEDGAWVAKDGDMRVTLYPDGKIVITSGSDGALPALTRLSLSIVDREVGAQPDLSREPATPESLLQRIWDMQKANAPAKATESLGADFEAVWDANIGDANIAKLHETDDVQPPSSLLGGPRHEDGGLK